MPHANATAASKGTTSLDTDFIFHSFCVGLDCGGARQSFAVGTVSPLGTRPALVRTYPWHSPVARSGRSFPASRDTEKAVSWMRQVRSQVAEVNDSDASSRVIGAGISGRQREDALAAWEVLRQKHRWRTCVPWRASERRGDPGSAMTGSLRAIHHRRAFGLHP